MESHRMFSHLLNQSRLVISNTGKDKQRLGYTHLWATREVICPGGTKDTEDVEEHWMIHRGIGLSDYRMMESIGITRVLYGKIWAGQ